MKNTGRTCRRQFLGTSLSSVVAAGLGPAALVNAARTAVTAAPLVPVHPDVEPVVRVIENTSRERILPVIVDRLKQGLTYRQLLAGIFLTAIRNRTSTHHVLMMHSVHQASLNTGRSDRFLPLLWAVAAVKDKTNTKPILRPLKDSQLPTASQAPSFFAAAMQESDFEAADRALVGIARTQGPQVAYEHLWRWGAARNGGSNVGHAAIAVANTHRTLHAVGWHHAEPALRYALWGCVEDKGRGRLHKLNAERARNAHREMSHGWMGGPVDRAATTQLMPLLRKGEANDACRHVFDDLRRGTLRAATVWDALLLMTAEMALAAKESGGSNRHRHSVTMTNGLLYIFRSTRDPELRLFALLEAVEWATKFRAATRDQDSLRPFDLTELAVREQTQLDDRDAARRIFEVLPPRRSRHVYRDLSSQDESMQLTFDLASQGSAEPFLRTARRMMCRKARGSHDFKYPVAIFEHFHLVSPMWKPHVLSASVVQLQGTQIEDDDSQQEAVELLRG